MAMSLATPITIRTLQRKLYRKAKAEPAFRFYLLYDKICREDILRHACGLARANAGAPGVDGVNFAQIEAPGLEGWLARLRERGSNRHEHPLDPPGQWARHVGKVVRVIGGDPSLARVAASTLL